MKTLQFFLLVAFAAVVYSQLPVPCQTPNQWSAIRVRIDPKEKREVKEKYFYDKIFLRKRHAEEIVEGDSREFLDVYNFHQQQRRYTYNPKTKTCNMTLLTEPFRVYEISPGDRFVGESVIGSMAVPGEGVTVQIWTGTIPQTGDRFVGAWTLGSCLLVNHGYFNNMTGLVEKSDYFDITLGVNPNDFIPPPECTKLNL